jgi:hypothetical protein
MPQAGFETAIPANQVAAGKEYIPSEKMEKSKWIYYIYIYIYKCRHEIQNQKSSCIIYKQILTLIYNEMSLAFI